MCLGRAPEPRRRLLTLAAPRANDCTSRRRSGRPGRAGSAAAERPEAGRPLLPPGLPGSGRGAPEAHPAMKRLPPWRVRAGARVQGQSREARWRRSSG